jgi:hypothetical protein
MSRKARKCGRLKAPDGEIITYPDIPTVQEWIVLGRITRAHQIYDSHQRRWRLIEELPDLAAFIQLREANAVWETAHSQYLASIGS